MNAKNLKIGFDAKRAFLNGSGLGNYSRTLISNLQKFYPDNNYHLFTPRKTSSYFIPSNEFKIHEPQTKFYKRFTSYWRSYVISLLSRKLNLNIYHGLSNELPQNILKFKSKKIITVHDLIFMRYPKLYNPLDRKIYEKKCKQSCRAADIIIAISEQTKNDLVIFFGISPSKIKVIYQAVDERFLKTNSNEELQRVKNKHNLPNNYLLFVSSIEERKNLQSILKALIDLPDQKLVVVGKKTNFFNTIESYISENKIGNRVTFLDNVTNDDLPKIYALANIFIYPSLFEGFGIPIIEAIASKVPVITTKGSCFGEAGGKAAIYTTYGNIEELKQAIILLTENNVLRTQLISQGQQHILNFYPEKTSRELMELYTS